MSKSVSCLAVLIHKLYSDVLQFEGSNVTSDASYSTCIGVEIILMHVNLSKSEKTTVEKSIYEL